MAGPAETLSFVARRLIQFEQRFAQADLARKRAASSLFSRISRSLQTLVADLGRDLLPHEACRELAFYSTKLKECAGEELGAGESDRLSQALAEASDKEKIYLEYRSSEHRKYLTEELEKASILIQALANGIYMAPPEDAAQPERLHPRSPKPGLDFPFLP
ncbi:MAG TPA: hypothetical protein VJ385_10605 [Fibrobacteria bacterium]|nr:hypothetical protein [Fibrobacteria bacterium]